MAAKVGMESSTVAAEIGVRELDMERDLQALEELERMCQVGLSGDQGSGSADGKKSKKKKKKKERGMSLCVEQIGDPLARVRHAPEHVVLVAECGKKMVGVIKACIKMVSRGGSGDKSPSSASSSSSGSAKQRSPYVKVAFLLGLRVSPAHRRLGIGSALVRAAEEWSCKRGAAHATMATTVSNKASLALFTGRFGYKPFRRPVLLGRPVHARRLPVTARHRVFQLPPALAAAAYAHLLPPRDAEFLPADLPALLGHKLTLGTFVAIESTDLQSAGADNAPAPSFAVLSVWDQTRSLSLRVAGAPALLRHSLAAVRALDRAAPWLRVPSVPDIFRPFGAYLIYGVRMSGPEGPALLDSLCRHAHNMARENPACGVVAADLAAEDPAAAAIPSWRRFSCDEDVWCIKNLSENNATTTATSNSDDDDWAAAAPPGAVLFVDPREF